MKSHLRAAALFCGAISLHAVTLETRTGPQGQTCAVKILGALTEKEVMTAFDKAVPSKQRGLFLREMVQCAGACQTIRTYEKVLLINATTGAQTSTPSALILFRSKDCEKVVEEVGAAGFTHLNGPRLTRQQPRRPRSFIAP